MTATLYEVVGQTGPRATDLARLTIDGRTSWTRRTALKHAAAYTARTGRPAFADRLA